MKITLICWCRNDEDVTQAAKDYCSRVDYHYFGCRRAALPQTLARLEADAALIVTAHGNDDVFGESHDHFTDMTVQEFAEALIKSVQKNWSGAIYLDICHGFDYAQKLKPLIRQVFPGVRVFGAVGETGVRIDISAHQEA